MAIRLKYDRSRGLYQVVGSADAENAAVEIKPSDSDNSVLGLDVSRGVKFSTSQASGISETSGSLLQLIGRSEGVFFHVGGNQYISNNCWFDSETNKPHGVWRYQKGDSSGFRWGMRGSNGCFDLDYVMRGTAGEIVTGSQGGFNTNGEWGTGLSMTASNGGIAIGKKANNSLSATFDVTGSNPIAFAVTGSADIGGGAADAYIIFPRHNNTTRDALTGVAGMVIYNTQTNKLNYHNGSGWQVVSVD